MPPVDKSTYNRIRRDTVAEIKRRLDHRLNAHLVEMKPGYDDSITGFNEAWEIISDLFEEMGK